MDRHSLPTCAVTVLLLLILPGSARAALAPEEGYALIRSLMSETVEPGERKAAAEQLTASKDLTLVPPLVDALFFTPKSQRSLLLSVLRNLTGENPGDRYYDWVELVGRRSDLRASPRDAPGYMAWKLSLLVKIDPGYKRIFYPGAPSRIALEEIVWGGVSIDGIPPLEDPPRVPAAEGGFLSDKETVFGVSAGGSHHAYPARYLSWHEMVNDTVGGEPLSLGFCTLCNTAVAYAARTPNGGRRTFGTSGLLYRSNKLMVDRQSWTLWNQLTGEPAAGRLANSPVRLEPLPLTVTTWGDWKAAHPDTTVTRLDPAFGARWGYDYRPGAADRQRQGVSFPVWQKSKALPPKEEIYGLRIGAAAKAWPIDQLARERIVHDRLGDSDLVLLMEGDAVRVYRRDGRTFRAGVQPRELLDEAGRVWAITEEALVPRGAEEGSPSPLPRVPGAVAFWFGWFGFHPGTEVWVKEEEKR